MKIKAFVIILCLLTLAVDTHVFADEDITMLSQRGFVRFMPLYQCWTRDGGSSISEISAGMFAYVPLRRNLSISLRETPAAVSSDISRDIHGLSDMQMDLSFYQESMQMLFFLGLNLPTGKGSLSYAEYTTSYLISLNEYNFKVPNFGQGFNIAPGVSWVREMSDNVVIGIGASYQYRGAFQPFKDLNQKYNPGDEILITGGIDFRLNSTSTLSFDGIYTLYGKDKMDDNETYKSGNKILISSQFKKYFEYNQLLVLLRYRSKDKNQVAIAGSLITEEERTIPNQFEFLMQYRLRVRKEFYTSFLFEGRFFDETALYKSTNIFGIGVLPEVMLSNKFSLLLHFKYYSASVKDMSGFSGFDAGVGIEMNF